MCLYFNHFRAVFAAAVDTYFIRSVSDRYTCSDWDTLWEGWRTIFLRRVVGRVSILFKLLEAVMQITNPATLVSITVNHET